jgi:hypothetical protein
MISTVSIFLIPPETPMAEAPTASSERSTTATPRLDPVAKQLRDDGDVFARLAALEARTAPPQLSSIAQYARPPPSPSDDELGVRCYTVKETAKLLRLGLSRTYESRCRWPHSSDPIRWSVVGAPQ